MLRILMSPKKRYVYIWSKTKQLNEVSLPLSVNGRVNQINVGGQNA